MGLSPEVEALLSKSGTDRLPVCSWPGGYTVLYLCSDGSVFCADCANGKNNSDVRTRPYGEDKQWDIECVSSYSEGPVLYCAHCDKDIGSDYGDLEDIPLASGP